MERYISNWYSLLDTPTHDNAVLSVRPAVGDAADRNTVIG